MAMIRQIFSLLRKRREGLSFARIAGELGLSPKEKVLLKKKLKKMESQGAILRLKSRYFIAPRSNITRGRFIASLRGYGFVSPDEDSLEDIFIPARYSGGAQRGDVVEVLYREKGKKGKPEGKVVRILKKEKKSLIGLYREKGGQAFFLPLDSPFSVEIPITQSPSLSPQPGMIVEVERDNLSLKQILGLPDDQGVDTKVVFKRYNLASSFSKEALKEAEEVSAEVALKERNDRVDYRSWLTVTIDGENAQDFDDAVSIKKLKNGHFLLGVHIADVSHYVRPGSCLDKEAYLRGTSIYFPDLTLPMLPEKLSNNVCSLRPREERLTLSVLLEISAEGKVLKTEFHPSLIRTRERMTYDSVYKILEEDERERNRYSYIVPDLFRMRDLARLLRKERLGKGSLDFDLAEPELVYKEGTLHSVVPFETNEAHQIIEEFMVAANEAAAVFLFGKDIPLIFRIHPPPALEDLERLREMLSHFHIYLPHPKKIKSINLQSAIKQAEGKSEEKFITLQVLKSLRLAVYSDENEGHYGLAKREYTHFTSPIRRYPDLAVHRILKSALRQEKVKASSLSAISLYCSDQERKAGEAERDIIEWRIFRFLKGKLGDEFEGVIVDVSRAGLVVELNDYFVDGIIPFSDLGRDYYFRKSERTLIGRKTGRIYELGDRLKVILASVDPILRRMTLTLPSR
ncbi:MAG: ribonuclease R [Candidatus Aminicenantes bacterium]|nr:MAG: ribonuclease R [Candidatus Aminicenantes bacterium]